MCDRFKHLILIRLSGSPLRTVLHNNKLASISLVSQNDKHIPVHIGVFEINLLNIYCRFWSAVVSKVSSIDIFLVIKSLTVEFFVYQLT